MKEVQVHDKRFRELLEGEKITNRIAEIAEKINIEFSDRDIVFLGILNGAFLFAAELFKQISVDARISFVKLASYEGISSSGAIRELIGWNEDIKDKEVIIIEDIVDTGNTLERIVDELKIRKVAGVKVATLLFKPDAYTKKIPLDYVGFEIPNEFVVGWGLDYNGYGRNLTSIYTLIK